MKYTSFHLVSFSLILFVLVVGGCVSLGGSFGGTHSTSKGGRKMEFHAKPLSVSEYSGIEKLIVTTYAQSTVDTQKPDLGLAALSVAGAAAGAVTGLTMAGIGAEAVMANPQIAAGVGQGIGMSIFTAEGKGDSLQFSRRIQQNIGNWQLEEVFETQLSRALEWWRGGCEVELVDLMESMKRPLETGDAEGNQVKEDAESGQMSEAQWKERMQAEARQQPYVQMENKGAKQINAHVFLTLTGRKRPYLTTALVWFPSPVQKPAGSDQDEAAAFNMVDKSVEEKAASDYHMYMLRGLGHSRDEWVKDSCAVLKSEVDSVLSELCRDMASDLFGDSK